MNPNLIADLPLLLALAMAPVWGGHFDPMPAVGLAVLAWLSLLLRLLLPGAGRPSRPIGAVCLVGFLLTTALSAVFAVTPGAAVLQTAAWWGGGAALLSAAAGARAGGTGRLIAAVLAGGFLAGASGAREYLEHLRAGDPGWRVFYTFSNPNFLAGYLTPCLLLLAGAALRRPAAFRPAMWLLAVALPATAVAAGLATTGSRGGLLSLAVGAAGLVTLLALSRGRHQREDLLRLLVVAILVGVVFVTASRVLRGREGGDYRLVPEEFAVAAREGSGRESSRFRILTWQGALAMGLARPLTGWGPGSFESAYERHARAGFTRHAHSSYLQLFAECGVLAALLFAGLLLVTAVQACARVRSAALDEGAWSAPVAAAVGATAVHNVFDSIFYVPACGLLTWVLLGLLLSTPAKPVPTPEPAEPVVPSRKQRRKGRTRPEPATRIPGGSPLAAAGAGAAMLLSAGLWAGCALLREGRGLVSTGQWSAALESLRTAQLLLPLDHRVADELRRAYRGLGDWDRALAAGSTAIRLAPERAAGYDFVAVLRNFTQRPDMALETYRIGLEHAPNNLTLLSNSAELLFKLGRREEALQRYRRIVEVEESAIGQVLALGEVRDHRFARARVAVAADLERADRTDAAFEQRLRAAVLLAERRRLFDSNPLPYMAAAAWDPRTERDLRSEEEGLWLALLQAYETRGDRKRTELSREMVRTLRAARPKLEETIRMFQSGPPE